MVFLLALQLGCYTCCPLRGDGIFSFRYLSVEFPTQRNFIFLSFTIGTHAGIKGIPHIFCLFACLFQLDKINFKIRA
jgi:hypothetical protein